MNFDNRSPQQLAAILKANEREINIVLNDGGLGDQICRLPAIIYTINNFTWIKVHLWLPDYFVPVAHHILKVIPNIAGRLRLYPLSKIQDPTLFNGDLPGYMTTNDYVTSLRTHLVDHGFRLLSDTGEGLLGKHDRDYPKIRLAEIGVNQFNLPSRYVVLTTGYTARNRAWLGEEINKVARWLNEQKIAPVFLGTTQTITGTSENIEGKFEESIDYSLGLNLIGQTTLLQAARILGQSRAVCGVDNGLLHLAACAHEEVPIVAGFTNVDPRIRIPYRKGTLGYKVKTITAERLSCGFCQTKYHYFYETDFRKCLFDDFACLSEMKGEYFIKKLKEIL